MENRDELGLLRWQFEGYPVAHRDRRNLVIHILSAPLFGLGLIGLPTALALGMWWVAIGCAIGIVTPVVVQGIGHRMEHEPPQPFRGPLDVVKRLFVEQLITFPRFVLSGGFARAWRNAGK